MTNRLMPNAKTFLSAALAASALMGLSACGSSAKPSVAAGVTAAPTASAPAAVPSTTQQSPASGGSAPSNASTANSGQISLQTQTPAPAKSTTKPAAPRTTSPAGDSGELPGACSPDHLKGAVTSLAHPLNHVLLTVTNTGSATCSLYYYPDLRLDADQQSVTQPVEDSKPQAVVSIAPGGSAYAAIGTSSSDGSGGTPQLEKQVEVFLESRDQSGSLPGSMTLPLPAGTYVDLDKAFVTYWESDLQSAISW